VPRHYDTILCAAYYTSLVHSHRSRGGGIDSSCRVAVVGGCAGGAISAKWRKIITRGRASAVRPRRVVDGSAAAATESTAAAT